MILAHFPGELAISLFYFYVLEAAGTERLHFLDEMHFYSHCFDGCMNGSPREHAYLCASAHDEISRMFTRWSHELA